MTRHRANNGGFVRGLIFGVVIGLICTAAAGSWAAMNKEHWEKRNWHFQVGYLAGFLDVVRILQARHPNVSLSAEFQVPPHVPAYVWRERVRQLYQDEQHVNRPLTQIIVIAGDKLASERGYVRGQSGPAGFDGLQRLLTERNRRIVEEARESRDGEDGAGGAGSSSDTADPPADASE